MSNFTDWAENKIADFFRGQGLTLPTSWFLAIGSAASDTSFTELTGTGYSRKGILRSLGNWAGTQGSGTTLASNGTSHQTSNNIQIDFGSAGSSWGAGNYVGLFDALTSGHCWMYLALSTPRTINSSDAVLFDFQDIVFSLGLTGGTSDYLSNKMIDLIFRGQAYTWPAATYIGLYTVSPTNATGTGTEVSGGAYARVALASNMTALSGTQGATTTAASTGTAGLISNNGTLIFPTPTADWGTVVAEGIHDASTSGNRLFWGTLAAPKTINSGASPPTHSPASVQITVA